MSAAGEPNCMSQVFPLRSSVSLDDRKPRLVDLDDEVADDVFEALSSRTTRRIFSALHEEPQTASDLATVTDTSVQNAQYHLEKLQDADLVEVVDTWYSERGTEMKVYAPTDESLVLFAGDDGRSLRSLLKRALAAVGLLGLVSLLVSVAADRLVEWTGASYTVTVPESTDGPEIASGGGDGGGGGSATGDAVAERVADGAGEFAGAASGVDPALLAGLACFVGGLFVLSMIGVVWYWRQRVERTTRVAD